MAAVYDNDEMAGDYTTLIESELTGRPVGSAEFVVDLERLFDRPTRAALASASRSLVRGEQLGWFDPSRNESTAE